MRLPDPDSSCVSKGVRGPSVRYPRLEEASNQEWLRPYRPFESPLLRTSRRGAEELTAYVVNFTVHRAKEVDTPHPTPVLSSLSSEMGVCSLLQLSSLQKVETIFVSPTITNLPRFPYLFFMPLSLSLSLSLPLSLS